MKPLPMLDASVKECPDGCGRCCMHVGTPPGMYAAYLSPKWDGVWMAESPDYELFKAMPPELVQSLRDYYDAVDAGSFDRSGHDVPCLWYDAGTQRCRHYEHRPQACREAVIPGDEHCNEFRAEPRPAWPAEKLSENLGD